MAKYDWDLIVIGGGAAGLTSSTAAGSVGAKVLLIEKEEKLGGDCLHYGCVPSKTLIKSAYVNHTLKNAQNYGLPKVEMPPVEFKNIAKRIQDTIDSIQVHDDPKALKDKYKVNTAFGSPTFKDNHTIIFNGKEVTAKNFVIATGSSAMIPPIENIENVPYLTNVEVFSLTTLPKSMIVLGGGPIGMEMSQSFARLGTNVTVVEFMPKVLAREDEDVSDHVESVMRKEGLELHLGTKAVRADKKDDGIVLTVEKEGKEFTLEADVLLVATGRKPNVEGLDLEKASVEYDKRGIKVDKRLRTSTKNIYACGDVNGSLPFTHVAGYEGGIAMMNAVYNVPLKADYTNVPWVTYTDPEVASIGLNETRAKEAGISYTVQKEELKNNDRAKAEGELGGFIKILINKKGVPIGCQIVGFHAGDLIHEWVAIINGKISLSTVGNAVHAYPTLSEVNKMASLNYFVSAGFFTKLRLLLNWRW